MSSNAIIEMPSPAVPPLETRLAQVVEEAVALVGSEIRPTVTIVVKDQEGLDELGAVLNRVAAAIADGHAEYDPIVEKSHAAHQEALKLRHTKLDRLEWFWAAGKKAIGRYVEIQKEKAAAEARRLAAIEEERLAKIREAEIEALEKQGAEPGLIAAVCEEPLPAVKPTVAPTYTMPAGFTSRATPYAAEVTSIKLLCKAVFEGVVPGNYVLPNMPVLNKRAAADKEFLNIPGIKAVAETGLSKARM